MIEVEGTVAAHDLKNRLARLRLWCWQPNMFTNIELAFADLPETVSFAEVEERLECIPDLCPQITVARWATICEVILPELYDDPKASKKTSAAIPGSRSRQWRLEERARTGLSLFHNKDSLGVKSEERQLSLF